MEKQIGIGLIIGLTVSITIWIWSSVYFNKIQKSILTLFALFPPFQWFLIGLFSIYNRKTNSTGFRQKKVFDNEEALIELEKKGILTKEEYLKKAKEVKEENETIFKSKFK